MADINDTVFSNYDKDLVPNDDSFLYSFDAGYFSVMRTGKPTNIFLRYETYSDLNHILKESICAMMYHCLTHSNKVYQDIRTISDTKRNMYATHTDVKPRYRTASIRIKPKSLRT